MMGISDTHRGKESVSKHGQLKEAGKNFKKY